MNKNRIGCFSTSAFLASLLTLLAISGVAFVGGNGMFSAGGLNAQAGETIGGVRSHSEIGNDCARCHPAPWEKDTQDKRCMVCHSDITAQLADANSMHGLMLKNTTAPCRDCHTDHRGPVAPLTDMTSGNFPHAATGYSLASHVQRSDGQAFTCVDCHLNDVSRFDPLVCNNCHQQLNAVFMSSHEKAYGVGCLACHDGVETLGKNFDHNLVVFKLDGKHQDLTCEKCHANAHSPIDFKTLPVDCGNCHLKDDAHTEQFGQDCGKCHTPAGWQPATFDHNLTNFKLEGKHFEIKCTECHLNKVYKGTPAACYACHQKDDEHKGEFGQDCNTCHNPAGWQPATFDHNTTAFKLEGKHAEAKCSDCHINKVFKGTPTTCYACHQKDDQHAGKFGQDCGTCHKPEGWTPATFDHNLSAFKLTGAHVNVSCEKCHINNVFQGTSTQCSGCHRDPAFHAGLFTGMDCSTCHTTSAWLPGAFNLPHPQPSTGEGGSGIHHGGASCRDCHTINLNSATCTKCHSGNNPQGGGGGD